MRKAQATSLALRGRSRWQTFLVQVGRPDESRTLHVVFNWPEIVNAGN